MNGNQNADTKSFAHPILAISKEYKADTLNFLF